VGGAMPNLVECSTGLFFDSRSPEFPCLSFRCLNYILEYFEFTEEADYISTELKREVSKKTQRDVRCRHSGKTDFAAKAGKRNFPEMSI
jgi:hypothetical protein